MKNILTYHKKPLYAMLLMLLLITALGVCLATHPRTAAETNSDISGDADAADPVATETDADGYLVYSDQNALISAIHTRGQAALLSENKIQSAQDIVSFSVCLQTETETVIDWNALPAGEHYPVTIRFFTLGNKRVSQFNSTVDFYRSETMFFLRDEPLREITDVSDKKQAAELEPNYTHVYEYDARNRPVSTINYLADHLRTEDPDTYNRLREPISAAQTLLPLTKGEGSFLPEDLDAGIVTWMFDESEEIHIQMCQNGEIWYPSFIWESSPRLYNEDLRLRDQQYLRQLTRIQEYLTRFSEDKVSCTYEDYNNQCDSEISDEFVLLSETTHPYAALYGLFGGRGAVLKTDRGIYPITALWDGKFCIQLDSGDFDGDGQNEYALIRCEESGIACLVERLYMIEEETDALTIHQFSPNDYLAQLDRGISWNYDPQLQELAVSVDQKPQYLLSLSDYFQAYSPQEVHFQELVWGEMIYVEIIDGQPCLMVFGGIQNDFSPSIPDYSILFQCPVQYQPDGRFILCDISVRTAPDASMN